MGRLAQHRPDLVAELTRPAPAGARAGVNRYLHDLYGRREDLRRAWPDLDGEGGERLVEWALVHGWREVPIPRELLPHARPGLPLPPDPLAERGRPSASGDRGVNVVGYLRAATGLGEAARLVVAGLEAAGVPVSRVARRVPEYPDVVPFDHVQAAEATSPINLHCLNPRQLWRLRLAAGPDFFAGRHNAGLWWWELPGVLPVEWWIGFEMLDEVWAGTRPLAETLAAVSPIPVHKVTLPVRPPEPPDRGRDALGLPDGFCFLSVFDYESGFERKNPLAVVEAFGRAFAPGEGPALVLKSVNADRDPAARERVERAAAGRPDVHLRDEMVAAGELAALMAGCDCLVSLHRAEGFGLPLADAMARGKPVLATGWSGNLEFMTDDNSYLVGFELRPVGEAGGSYYPHEAMWAEPEVDHAAALMRRIVSEPAERERRARRAAEHMAAVHAPQVAGREMAARLEAIRAARPIPRGRLRSRLATRLARTGGA